MIGLGKLVAGRTAIFKIQKLKTILEVLSCPYETNRHGRRYGFNWKTPIYDDASLHKLQEQVADYVREAKHRDPSEPNELISTVLDEVARDYFRHAIRKQRPPRHLGDEHLDANAKAGSG